MQEKLDRLNNVLQWTIAQSKEGVNEGEGRTEEELQEMKRRLEDKSNREFLEKVLKSDVEYMKEFTAILKKEDSKEQDVLNAVCELQNFVEQIDNANDLDKIGGLQPVIKCTQNKENKDIRKNAFVVIGMVAQNNPEGKKKIMQKGGLVHLIKTLREDKEDEVLERAVYALSCLAKHEPQIQEALIKMKALGSLADILKSKDIKDATKMKIIFFLTRLMIEDEKKWASYYVEIEIPQVVSELVKAFDINTSLDLIEKSIDLINQLVKNDDTFLKQFSIPELYQQLAELLNKKKEANKEDSEYIEQLLTSLKL